MAGKLSAVEILSQMKFIADQNSLAAVKAQVEKSIGPLKLKIQSDGLSKLNNDLKKYNASQKDAVNGLEDFGAKAALAGKRFAAFSVATAGVFALTSAMKNAIGAASDFNVELTKVQQVTKEGSSNVVGLGDEVFKISKDLGVSSQELLSVGLTLGQAGKSIADIKELLRPLAQTRLAATFGDITDTVNAAIAAQAQFRLSNDQLGRSLSTINTLSAKYAVEADDLTVAIQKAGGAFATLSNDAKSPEKSLNELLSIFTAVRSTTRESADTIATGLRTIFARIRRPKTIEFLREFGIELQDASGKLKDPLKAVQEIARVTENIKPDDIRFSQIIEEIGGIRQQSKVIPLLQQIDKAEEALIVSTRNANSLTRDQELAQETLANQVARTKEEFLELINKGFNSDAFQNTAKTALSIASAFLKIGEAIAPIIPAITALGAISLIKAGPAIARGFAGVAPQRRNSGGPIYRNAGTFVPGVGNSDTVDAKLTPGEFVIRKDAAKVLGPQKLHELNHADSNGVVQKFKDGGEVQRFARGGKAQRPKVEYDEIKSLRDFKAFSNVEGVKLPTDVRRSITSSTAASNSILTGDDSHLTTLLNTHSSDQRRNIREKIRGKIVDVRSGKTDKAEAGPEINQLLKKRTELGISPESTKSSVLRDTIGLRASLSKTKLPSNLITYSGLDETSSNVVNNAITNNEKTFTLKRFLSTSTDKDVARDYSTIRRGNDKQSTPTLLRIRNFKGQQAGVGSHGEQEVILPNRSSFSLNKVVEKDGIKTVYVDRYNKGGMVQKFADGGIVPQSRKKEDRDRQLKRIVSNYNRRAITSGIIPLKKTKGGQSINNLGLNDDVTVSRHNPINLFNRPVGQYIPRKQPSRYSKEHESDLRDLYSNESHESVSEFASNFPSIRLNENKYKNINSKKIPNDVIKTLKHEFVHHLDFETGERNSESHYTGETFSPASSIPGSSVYNKADNLSRFVQRYKQLKTRQSNPGNLDTTADASLKYLSRPTESLAQSLENEHIDSILNTFTGGGPSLKRLRRNLRNKVAKYTGGKERPQLFADGGTIQKFANGGPVGGSGTGDKIPALLSPKEYVIPADSAQKLGQPFLESIRRGEKPPGYSDGGGPGYKKVFNAAKTSIEKNTVSVGLPSLTGAIGAFAILSNTLDKTGAEVDPMVKALQGAGIQFAVLASAIGATSAAGQELTRIEQSKVKLDERRGNIATKRGLIKNRNAFSGELQKTLEENAQRATEFETTKVQLAGLKEKVVPTLTPAQVESKKKADALRAENIRLGVRGDLGAARTAVDTQIATVTSQYNIAENKKKAASSRRGTTLSSIKELDIERKEVKRKLGEKKAQQSNLASLGIAPGSAAIGLEKEIKDLESQYSENIKKRAPLAELAIKQKQDVSQHQARSQKAKKVLSDLQFKREALNPIYGRPIVADAQQRVSDNESKIASLLGTTDAQGRSVPEVVKSQEAAKGKNRGVKASRKKLKEKLGKLTDDISKGNKVVGVYRDKVETLNTSIDSIREQLAIEPNELKGLIEDQAVAKGTPVKGRKSFKTLQRLKKAAQYATPLLVGAGAAGSYFSETGAKSFESSRGLSGSSSIVGGSIAQSAGSFGTTALLASGGNPIAGAVGAVVGGLYGLVSGLSYVKQQLNQFKVQDAQRGLARSIDLLKTQGRGNIQGNLAGISSRAKDIYGTFLKDPNDKEVKDRAQSAAIDINVALREAVKGFDEFKQFQAVSGDLINFVSRFTAIPVSEINEELKKELTNKRALRAVTLQEIQTRKRESLRTLYATSLNSVLNDVSTSIEAFDSVLNGGVADLSGVFDRLGQISDNALLDRATTQAKGTLNVFGAEGTDFINEAKLANSIGQKLPTLLTQTFRNDATDTEFGTQLDAFRGLLETTFQGPEAKSSINSVVSQLSNFLSGKKDLKDEIESNLSGLVEDITSNLRKSSEVIKLATQVRLREVQFLESSFSKIRDIQEQRLGLELSNVDLSQEITTKNSRYGLPVEQGRAFEAARGKVLGTDNPNALGEQLRKSQAELDRLNKQRLSGDVEGDKELESARSRELSIIERTTKALRFLADAGQRAAVVENEIAKESQLRDTKLGLFKTITFGGTEDRKGLANQLKAALKFSETKDVTSVPPEFRQGGLNLLEQFGDALIGGVPASKIIEDIIVKDFTRNAAGLLGGEANAAKFAKEQIEKSKTQKNLEEERTTIYKRAIDSNTELSKTFQTESDKLSSAINTQFPAFIESLVKLKTGEDIRRVEVEQSNVSGQLKESVERRRKASTLSLITEGAGLGNLSEQNLGVLQASLTDLQKIGQLREQNKTLQTPSNIHISDEPIVSRDVVRGVLPSLNNQINQIFGKDTPAVLNALDEYVNSIKTGISDTDINDFLNNKRAELLEQNKLSETQLTKGVSNLSPEQVNKLVPRIGEISKLFEDLGGLSKEGSLAGLNIKIQELSGTLIRVTGDLRQLQVGKPTDFVGPVRERYSEFAVGGYVGGTGNTDTIPAMLTPGEFVLRKSAAESLGADTLNQLNHYNKGGRVKFATGGLVGKLKKIDEEFAPIHADANVAFGRVMDKELESAESRAATNAKLSGQSTRTTGNKPYRDMAKYETPEQITKSLAPKTPPAPPPKKSSDAELRRMHLAGELFDARFGNDTFGKYKERAVIPGVVFSRETPSGTEFQSTPSGIKFKGQNKGTVKSDSPAPLAVFAETQGKKLDKLKVQERTKLRQDFQKQLKFGQANKLVGTVDPQNAKLAESVSLYRTAQAKTASQKSYNTTTDSAKAASIKSKERKAPKKFVLAEALERNAFIRESIGVTGSLGTREDSSLDYNKYMTRKAPNRRNSYFKNVGTSDVFGKKDAALQKKIGELKTPQKNYRTANDTSKSRLSASRGRESDIRDQRGFASQLMKERLGATVNRIEALGRPNAAKSLLLERAGTQDARRSSEKYRTGSPDFPDTRFQDKKPIRRNSGGGTSGKVVNPPGASNKGLMCELSKESLNQFEKAIADFSRPSLELSKALNEFPREISMSATHSVTVYLSGGEILSKIQPEVERLVIEKTKETLNTFIDKKFTGMGRV